jgi:hypothetical protein
MQRFVFLGSFLFLFVLLILPPSLAAQETYVSFRPTDFYLRVDANGNVAGDRTMNVSVSHSDHPSFPFYRCGKVREVQLKFDGQRVDSKPLTGGGLCSFNPSDAPLQASVISEDEARSYCASRRGSMGDIKKNLEVDLFTGGHWVTAFTSTFTIHLDCLAPSGAGCGCPTGFTCVGAKACSSYIGGRSLKVICPEGQDCFEGQCRPRDVPNCDPGCKSGYTCQEDKCVETACIGIVCDPGFACSAGKCVDKACVGIVCPEGTVCSLGKCVH